MSILVVDVGTSGVRAAVVHPDATVHHVHYREVLPESPAPGFVQFDAAAMPMFASFQPEPNVTPYATRPATVSLEDRNAKTAWGARASLRMDFTKDTRPPG